MTELESLKREALHRMYVLEPLAAAEEAANVPPTPDSSQAAFHAAWQRYIMLSDINGLVYSRASECIWPER